MGCTSSSPTTGEAEQLEPQIMLVMGNRGSGRTTFARQIQVLTRAFSDGERTAHLPMLRGEIVRSVREALRTAAAGRLLTVPEIGDLDPDNVRKAYEFVTKGEEGELAEFGPKVVAHIKTLWKHANIHDELCIESHLLDKIDDIARDKYVPTDLDLQHVGVRTQGFGYQERLGARDRIHAHVLGLLTYRLSWLGDRLAHDRRDDAATVQMEAVKHPPRITPELAGPMLSLWREAKVRDAGLAGDHAGYFMNRVREIAEPHWVPSDNDVVHVPEPTDGAFSHTYEDDDCVSWTLRVASSRESSGSATCLVYLCSLATYDETDEDAGKLRILAAMDEFEELLSTDFQDKPAVLVLTQRDVFAEKIAKKPLVEAFPEYRGKVDGVVHNSEADAALQYIIDRFQSRESAMQVVSHHIVNTLSPKSVLETWNQMTALCVRVANTIDQ